MAKKRQYTLLLGVYVVILTCVVLVPRVYGLAESTASGGSNVQAVHALGEKGDGVNIGVITVMHARVSHKAFKDSNDVSHISWYDASDQNTYEMDTTGHDTWVVGTAASRGDYTHPNYIGVSPEVEVHNAKVTRPASATDPNRVYASDFSWFDDALKELITNRGCRVIVSGLAFPATADTMPDGLSHPTLLYDYYAQQYDVVISHAAGNNPNRIQVFGDAYNGITTGGLILLDPDDERSYLKIGSITGAGPTDDGRRKPDIVAPSQNQTVPHKNSDTSWFTWVNAGGETSLSAPHTEGLAALLWGLADDTPESDDGHSEVIRAVIVNSTFPNIRDRSGNTTNPLDSNNTWHQQRGYGRIDGLQAYNLLTSAKVTPSTSITDVNGWAFGNLAPAQEHTYLVSIPKNYRIVATITWDRRVLWTDEWQQEPPRPPNGEIDPGELHPYLADLDMLVFEPNNTTAIFTEELAGLSPDDNLEKCDLLAGIGGQYIIRIENNSTNGENADYGFAFELIEPVQADLNLDYGVDEDDLVQLKNNWLQNNPDVDAALFEDGTVNLKDFAVLAENWRSSNPAYYSQ